MLDHVGFAVTDIEKSKAFYQAALAPLGLSLLTTITPEMTGDGTTALGFGKDRPFFWFGDGDKVGEGVHFAFAAASHAEVEDFYEAAIAAGGRDNGGPGIRAIYHPNYYAAFVYDPDGVNVEAVCHAPGDAGQQEQFNG
jgi:catechol 2,3-dioxygenase-like lactoylglutathione lyase family enzyme